MIGPLGPARGDWAVIGGEGPGLCSAYVTDTQSRDYRPPYWTALSHSRYADDLNSVGKLGRKSQPYRTQATKIQCKGKPKWWSTQWKEWGTLQTGDTQDIPVYICVRSQAGWVWCINGCNIPVHLTASKTISFFLLYISDVNQHREWIRGKMLDCVWEVLLLVPRYKPCGTASHLVAWPPCHHCVAILSQLTKTKKVVILAKFQA